MSEEVRSMMSEAEKWHAKIQAGAEGRGLALHESVSPDRLARALRENMCTPEPLSNRVIGYLDVGGDTARGWVQAGYYIVGGRYGAVGAEVVGQPRTDRDLALVILPSWRVVAYVNGTGTSLRDIDVEDDGPELRAITYTVLSAQAA